MKLLILNRIKIKNVIFVSKIIKKTHHYFMTKCVRCVTILIMQKDFKFVIYKEKLHY